MDNTSITLEKNQGKITLVLIMILTNVFVVIYWLMVQLFQIAGFSLDAKAYR